MKIYSFVKLKEPLLKRDPESEAACEFSYKTAITIFFKNFI